MTLGQSSSLQLPSFLYGSYPSVHQKTQREGLWCGEKYREDGSFPTPRQMLEVTSGDVVVAHEVVDFQRERPTWRLYMVSNLKNSLYEALDWQNSITVRDAYEAFFRETAWGALHFAISPSAPVSAECTALRLQAVLRFWEPLQSARYLFSTPNDALTLEELMVASCDWAMDAWCPARNAPVRTRLETAAEHMAQATQEDSLEAILRQMPRAFAHARDLKHREVLADPAFQRQRLTTLDPLAFERVSGAYTAELIGKLYDWDYELGMH
ncbi:hypothetical protein [Archangium sp.]|uniref:hypothetical protein n=1 Tax=Archangium sp. TaxID=1872627 RepID=UPI002D4B985F|nr:hypothetical protein [Archangium sp.]HYO57670.1 hypothetical protein [Archangium sp.]